RTKSYLAKTVVFVCIPNQFGAAGAGLIEIQVAISSPKQAHLPIRRNYVSRHWNRNESRQRGAICMDGFQKTIGLTDKQNCRHGMGGPTGVMPEIADGRV